VGGAEELIRESLPLIEAEGFEVTLWSLKAGGSLHEELCGDGARVRSLEGSSRWSPSVLGRLYAGLRRERFDLVHSHLFRANLAARLVGRAAGIPVIVNSHHGTDAWRQAWARGVERATAGLADRIVTCSESVRRSAVEEVGLPAEKVVAIPNGISTRRFADRGQRDAVRTALGLAGDRPVLGTVARLDDPDKGIAVLVTAMDRVVSQVPQAICLVVGDGPMRSSLEAQAQRLGLGHVRFLGKQSQEKLPEIYRTSSVFVLAAVHGDQAASGKKRPSASDLIHFGIPNVILEAMASGVPIVTTRMPALVEVFVDGETGVYVPERDPAALAAALEQLATAQARCARMGARALERIRAGFDIEVTSAEVAEALGA